MALNAWQKIDRVIQGFPFGNGSAGNTTISADPNTRATVTCTAGSLSPTLGSAILNNGDVFVVHQTVGTNHGQWEINRVISGGGTTTPTLAVPMHNTYTAGAQIIKFNLNGTLTINSYTAPGYASGIGAVSVYCGRTSVTINTGVSGSGFGGGAGNPFGNQAGAGDSSNATGLSQSGANGMGGGGGNNGGSNNSIQPAGGGAGHVTAGGIGGGNAGTSGGGGGTGGTADLTTAEVGAGGGGGVGGNSGSWITGGNGGQGGHLFIVISASIVVNATLSVDGVNGQSVSSPAAGGGGGSAGSVLGVCKTASLGTSLLTANAASGGGGTSSGGSSSVGRIAVHHSGTVTGTTSPTFTDVTDTSLIEKPPGGFFLGMMQ